MDNVGRGMLQKQIMNNFKPRFVKAEDMPELFNLYHLARTALAGTNPTNYERMIWASTEFAKQKKMNATAVYKDLSTAISW